MSSRPSASGRALPGRAGRLLLLAVLATAPAGCDLFGSDPVPTTVTVSPSSLDLDAVGESRTLSVEVLDEEGRRMPDVRVSWRSSDGAVASVSETGVVTTQGNGTATVTASAGEASGSMTVRVAQSVATLTLISGGGQTGTVGEPLPEPVVVLARDRNGNVARGAPIAFSVESGGGGFPAPTVNTDTQGLASATWTLGTGAGQQQRARVSGGGGTAVIQIDALSVAGPPDALLVTTGDGQSAPRGRPLPIPVSVRVTDRFTNPVPGVPVTFEVLEGEGSFDPASSVTGPTGEAGSTWTLGQPLGSQGARVLVEGLSATPLSAISLPLPAALEAVEGNDQTSAAGRAVPVLPAVRVVEAGGEPVVGLTVRFTVEEGGGSVEGGEAITDGEGVARPAGWVLGTRVGTNRLRAAVEGLDPVDFSATGVAGPAAAIQRLSGSGQAGPAGSALPSPLRARVVDAFGNAVAGARIQFRAQQGSVSATSATSGTDGVVQTNWTLGAQEGTQTATAFATEAQLPTVTWLAVTSAVPSDYSVDIRYTAPLSAELERMTEEAAARWATLVTGNLAPVLVPALFSEFCSGRPAVDEVVDDVLIYVRIAPIDGPGGILGGAAPCAVREEGGLPALGIIQLDSDDLARLPAVQSSAVILHEIAHVLGFGTLWDDFGLLEEPSLAGIPGADTHFTGPAAITSFDALGGARYNAAKVPVENTLGGQGTRDSHWRASVLNEELMTGFINAESNPLSALTVESLRDLGYQVDPSGADLFEITLTPAQQLAPGPGSLFLGNDILLPPIRVLSPEGELVRVIPRDFR